jgi:hypothetical protein
MGDLEWWGGTRAGTYNDSFVATRHRLADAAKAGDWNTVFDVLSDEQSLVNATRLEGKSLYAPLHQAAHAGAPVDVVARLLEVGAWRTLRNAKGERAVDVAERLGHHKLLGVLEPRLVHDVPVEILRVLRIYFHAVIRARAEDLVVEFALRLPEVEPLLELGESLIWFAVPGMYGGFTYRLEPGRTGYDAALTVESWCRMSEGSGQRHRITRNGVQLVAEGFC